MFEIQHQRSLQVMTAMRMRAKADKIIEILSRMEVILKKGSFYCFDLLINYFSMMLLATYHLILPFLMKLLNYSSGMTPFRYLKFGLYWLVLKPYVLVRQGMTTTDSLVSGMSLLLRISLYLSGRGKNSSLIYSCTSLCPLYIRTAIEKQCLQSQYTLQISMGKAQSAIYSYEIQIQNYSPKSTETGDLSSLAHLWASTEREVVGEKEIVIAVEGEKYVLRSFQDMGEVEQYCGSLEIGKKKEEGEIKLFQGIVQKGSRNGYGIVYGGQGELVYRGNFKDDLFDGWGQGPYYRGQFKAGKRHGWGTLIDFIQQRRFIYEGYFEGDQFHGIGCINVSQSEVRDFIEQNLMLADPNFNFKFVGEWKRGRISGKGKLVTVSEIYAGQFVNGLFEGEGRLISSLDKVEGLFYRGKQL